MLPYSVYTQEKFILLCVTVHEPVDLTLKCRIQASVRENMTFEVNFFEFVIYVLKRCDILVRLIVFLLATLRKCRTVLSFLAVKRNINRQV